jgi:hypothetical protein
MYGYLTKKNISELKDLQYTLKKDTFILHSNILQTEYEFQRKIDEVKTEFRKILEAVRNEFYSVEEDNKELRINNKKDMKSLAKRRTDIKEIFNISLCGLEHCEKEIGMDLLK